MMTGLKIMSNDIAEIVKDWKEAKVHKGSSNGDPADKLKILTGEAIV